MPTGFCLAKNMQLEIGVRPGVLLFVADRRPALSPSTLDLHVVAGAVDALQCVLASLIFTVTDTSRQRRAELFGVQRIAVLDQAAVALEHCV